MSPAEVARNVARGYLRILRSAGEALLVLSALAGAAVGVSYPIWWLAVNRRGLYSAAVGGAALAAAAVLAVRKLRSGGRAAAEPPAGRRRPIRFLLLCAFGAGMYGAAVAFLRSPVLGLFIAAALVAAAGAVAFGRGDRTDRGR